MNATYINSRTDIETYLADTRPDLGKFYVSAVCDQIQHSDHPAWGDDWSEWMADGIDGLIEETVSSLDALKDSDGGRTEEK